MIEFLAINSVARMAFLAILFVAIAMGVFGVMRVSIHRAETRAKVRQIADTGLSSSNLSLQERRSNAWSEVAERIEKAGLSLADSNDDVLRDRLRAAGYISPSAPKVYTLIRLVLVFALPIGYLLLRRSGNDPIETFDLYLYGIGLAAAGLYVPALFVRAKADRRREEITNGFPDCLDLMLVCVEAGLGLEAAMDRVGREMINSHPLVAQLLMKVVLQMRAGARREEALRRMGADSGVAEIKSFATLLIQSDKLGTSVADTLRVYAAEMREKRRLRAEERAHRLPVLISIPLVANMLPTMIGVLMLPGAVRIVRELIPALGGG